MIIPPTSEVVGNLKREEGAFPAKSPLDCPLTIFAPSSRTDSPA